ncbi:MAG TPA: GAF domain-containing sensor histidine kinase, partial [Roseiflexaceae bacterium]|nr:GAF domain-containing sensor histidine kinase [Roseiflexaceae bacterium]
MVEPPLPADEPERLAALRALELLDTPAEERFDRLTRLARRLFDAPIALVTLVDADRQWFKSRQGLDTPETPRRVSFCAHAVAAGQPLVVSDALQDPRFAANPHVTGPPHIRFYAGHPLRGPGGRLVGTLCVIDRRPRAFTVEDRAALADLANVAERELSQAEAARRATAAALEAERAQLARRVEERTADLMAANAQLARAARLKDEFLANMSHELRTPLNSILGLSEALEEEVFGPLTERQRRSVAGIAESGRHLLALINDILDLSKIEAQQITLSLEPIDVGQVCEASLRLVTQSAQARRLSVEWSLDSRVTTLVADVRRLKQILVNLLANAVKFTPEGGHIGLEVRGDRAARVVHFTVWDTGIGIAPEAQERLFKPFVQLDSSLTRRYEGSGLGLALVARLAELHGGGVTLESSPGAGSRFTVALPWVEQPQRAAPAPQ